MLFVRQVAPTIEDLSDRSVQVSELIREYPTGSWGDESRDYHVAVQGAAEAARRRAARRPRAARRRRRGRGAGSRARDLVRRLDADHADQSRGRALHRPGRARVGDPGGTRRQGGRRRRDRDDEARSRRAARGRDRQRRGDEQAASGWSRSPTPTPAPSSSSARSRSSTRWRSTRARPRRRGCADERNLPERPSVEHRRLLRRVRRADRRGAAPRRVRVDPRPPAPRRLVARPSTRRPPPRRRRVRTAATSNPADALFCEQCGYDFTTGQLPPRRHARCRDPGADWVAEIWIDPDWFAFQDSPGGCATSGAPTVVPLRGTTAHHRPTVEEPQPESRHRLRRTTAPCRTNTRS